MLILTTLIVYFKMQRTNVLIFLRLLCTYISYLIVYTYLVKVFSCVLFVVCLTITIRNISFTFQMLIGLSRQNVCDNNFDPIWFTLYLYSIIRLSANKFNKCNVHQLHSNVYLLLKYGFNV